MDEIEVDVMVVGGGAAGLSGALMLARARRTVLVVDGGQPRNAPAEGVHGLLGHDGLPPGELLARGRAEVASYGGTVVKDTVVGVAREGDGFRVALGSGGEVVARRMLLATGLVDRLPDVPGLMEHWGHDVVHCPYCHGWEVRDRPIAVLGTGAMSFHQVQLFRQWTDDLVFVQHDAPDPTRDERLLMEARGIRHVSGRVVEVLADGGGITGLRMADGQVVERAVIAVATQMEARAEAFSSLGLVAVDHPSGMGRHVPVDAQGRTQVEGLWAAGNVTDLSAQVGMAAAQGAQAGAMINMDLVLADGARAVNDHLVRLAPGPSVRPA
ncbi:NAD(P)/FAD-dependent oxidoreductase [Nocardioides alcanivorans]|uniref:NAD(P)/FAD-dependent oxidoreductase n=1 Tax=Nocardioides alcanivorans TaxID=2897352 RepID=UPI001F1D326B|nr:NAD(P)/FAD-dependent oxidoreductase [Nocardioides alcanivorans]